MNRISDNLIIAKNEQVQVNLFAGEDPYALGHIVVQPNSGNHDVSELGQREWRILAKWIPKVSKAMKKVLQEVVGKKVVKIYLCSFNESPEFPVHFHLVPRYECEKLIGQDLLYFRSKAKQLISPSDRISIVLRMQKELGIKEARAVRLRSE